DVARRPVDRLRAHREGVRDVEAISRRPDGAHLAGQPLRQHDDEGAAHDFNPMWAGDRVYFLSDRNGPVTLFYYDVKTKAVHEAIANRGLDLKSASLGPDAIVYEQFGGISVYDLKSGKTKPVAIRIQGDFPELRSRFVNVGKRLG